MKRSQAWSMDIMIAIIVFIGAIFIFYLILGTKQETKIEDLRVDATRVLQNINATENISQIEELLGLEYGELKRRLRVENDFCIYLEDEEGNVIYIQGKRGIGSDKIYISDEPCG